MGWPSITILFYKKKEKNLEELSNNREPHKLTPYICDNCGQKFTLQQLDHHAKKIHEESYDQVGKSLGVIWTGNLYTFNRDGYAWCLNCFPNAQSILWGKQTVHRESNSASPSANATKTHTYQINKYSNEKLTSDSVNSLIKKLSELDDREISRRPNTSQDQLNSILSLFEEFPKFGLLSQIKSDLCVFPMGEAAILWLRYIPWVDRDDELGDENNIKINAKLIEAGEMVLSWLNQRLGHFI